VRDRHLKRSNLFAAVLRWVAIAMAVTLVSAASVAAIALWSFSKKVDDNAIDISGGREDSGERPLSS